MEGYRAAARLLPPELRRAAEALPEEDCRRVEELRLRKGRPMTALTAGRERIVAAAPVTEEDLRRLMAAAARSSLHAAEHELCRGYLTGPGGVRVGLCGTAVLENGAVTGLRSVSSAAVRVPRQVPGCADGVWRQVTEGGFRSLLIISPPGAGKTTLLRELIRRLSVSGLRVCAADERGELAGGGFDLGPGTDVMTGAPKAAAAGMMLRAMNPQVVAMDEITDAGDARALLEAVGCGVRLLAAVHGSGPGEVAARPACGGLLAAGAFERYVTISCRDGRRRYEAGRFS